MSNAFENGTLDEDRVDEAFARVMALKQKSFWSADLIELPRPTKSAADTNVERVFARMAAVGRARGDRSLATAAPLPCPSIRTNHWPQFC